MMTPENSFKTRLRGPAALTGLRPMLTAIEAGARFAAVEATLLARAARGPAGRFKDVSVLAGGGY